FTVSVEDRPLLAAILKDEELLERYHEEYRAFLKNFFESGRFEKLFTQAEALITPYIEKGLTFYEAQDTKVAMDTVHQYFVLREESIRRQLSGRLPSTLSGQKEDYRNLVDASDLDLSTSVTFDSLVFGIESNDVYSVLDSLAGDHEHSSEGLVEAFGEMAEEPKTILKAVGRIIRNTPILRNAIESAVTGPILLILSIILLCSIRKRTIRYQRRKETEKEERDD
ncbi:MAG: hypothetical protein KBS81_02780, partial [Spirochaetales bacterium]|nr:hypothetical protein [Candidatus Physcosoma equi]